MFVKNLYFIVLICLISTAVAAKKNKKSKSTTTSPNVHAVYATAVNDSSVDCESDVGFQNPFANLTDAQKSSLKSLMEEIHAPNSTLTKDQVKAKLDAFKATLPTEIQNLMTRPTPSVPSTANLSAEAQALVSQLEAVKADGSITFAQEHEKIKNLIGNASESVKNELFKSGFGGHHGEQGGPMGFGGQKHGGFGGEERGRFGNEGRGGFGGMSGGFNGMSHPMMPSGFPNFQPGFGGMGGGHEKSIIPFFLIGNLTDAQKTQLKTLEEQIRSPNNTLTKDQIKSQIDAFKASLSSEVQSALNALPTPSIPPTPSYANLSSEAQALIAQVEAVKKDGSITPAQEHEKIKSLIGNATESVRNELQKLHPGHEGQFGGFGAPQGFGGFSNGFSKFQSGFGGQELRIGGPQHVFEQRGFGNFGGFKEGGFDEHQNRARRCRPKTSTVSPTA